MFTLIGKIRNAKKEAKQKELTKAEIQEKLKELGIEFDEKVNKADLLALLPQE